MEKNLLCLHSYHHGNTEKVARVIGERINADIKHPSDIDLSELQSSSMIGFGAGIDSGKHYKLLLDFAKSLPDVEDKKAFLFSTSGIYGEKKTWRDHTALREILIAKGYCIVGEFSCVGFNTNSFLKYFGGMNKGRPNSRDLQAAKEFADSLSTIQKGRIEIK